MSLMINQNITSLNAWKNLNKTDRSMSSTMEKLSSGLRINKAADDPSGLVISEQMRAQVVGLKAAIKNSEKGISMIQTAEGALDKVHALLDKMRGLALDSANSATADSKMLAANQAEITNILSTITRISEHTQYGTKKLLDGTNSATAASLGTTNTTGASSVVDSDLVAGTTGPLTVTLGTLAVADGIVDATKLTDSGAAFVTSAATQAATLTSGEHTFTASGSLDTVSSFAAGTSGIAVTTATAGTSYTGSFSGTLKIENTGAALSMDADSAAGQFKVYEGSTEVGTASWDTSATAFTISMNDGSASSTLTLAGATLTGTFAVGSTTPTSFTIAVTASTAEVSLDEGTAQAINRATQAGLTDVALTSGDANPAGGHAHLDLSGVTFNGSDRDFDFMVQKTGESLATLEDGAAVVVADNDQNVTLTSRQGSVSLDFGIISAGTTSIDITDNSLVFQIGANNTQTVKIGIDDVAATKLANVSTAAAGSALADVETANNLSEIDVTTAQGAQDAIVLIDAAIDQVSTIRGDLGAFQANTLEANLDSLRVSSENLQASESTIRDTDMAAEMATFTKYQIMMQAGVAMLAQANQSPNNLLTLLRG